PSIRIPLLGAENGRNHPATGRLALWERVGPGPPRPADPARAAPHRPASPPARAQWRRPAALVARAGNLRTVVARPGYSLERSGALLRLRVEGDAPRAG